MTGVTGTEPHGGGEAAASGRPRVPAAMAWRSLLPRPTLRLWLTVLYGALFLAAGALLLPLSFLLFRQGLATRCGRRFGVVTPSHSPGWPAPLRRPPGRTRAPRRGPRGSRPGF